MSELDLLADCLKDATKERDELAAALEQLQAEPTYRIRQEQAERIEQLEALLGRWLDADDWTLRDGFEISLATETREALGTAGDSAPDESAYKPCPHCGMVPFSTLITVHEEGCPQSVPGTD